ncbi:hypothetical protein AAHA92_16482 [Salvia divinorum]|uniref:Uncharacterized protein n=1 Tax=Salvia divinorum TaxID=28513 RepID=A0ABD1GVP4_SALDI
MTHNFSSQSTLLYKSSWTPALDSLLLGTMIRIKVVNEWDDTVFPSHFIIEAGSVLEHELGHAFDWAALYDRLHFLEKRYKTFKERNPLAGAYFYHGDPVYNELAKLFAYDAVKVEREKIVIVLSDFSESCNNDAVFCKNTIHDHGRDAATDSKPDGKLNKKLDNKPANGSSSRSLQPHIPPNYTSYSCDSNNPIMWWRMPRNPMRYKFVVVQPCFVRHTKMYCVSRISYYMRSYHFAT